jgi:subtilisin family serine protease
VSWFHVAVLPTSSYYNNTQTLADNLRGLPEIEDVNFDTLCSPHGLPSNPNDDAFQQTPGFPFTGTRNREDLERLNALSGFSVTWGETNQIAIAHFDAGVHLNHPDLANKVYRHPTQNYRMVAYVPAKGGLMVGDADQAFPNPKSGQPPLDLALPRGPNSLAREHGTDMAGIMAAESDNTTGITSCGPAVRFISITIEPTSAGKFPNSRIKRGIKLLFTRLPQADFKHIRVVNFSLGVEGKKDPYRKVIAKDLSANDRTYVASSGNTPGQHKIFPANSTDVLGVLCCAATVDNNQNPPPRTTTYNGCSYIVGSDGRPTPGAPDIMGLGRFFTTHGSSSYSNNTDGVPQTSIAAPQIAALAALVYSKNPSRLRGDVAVIIRNSRSDGLDGDKEITFIDSNNKTIRLPELVDFKKALDQ